MMWVLATKLAYMMSKVAPTTFLHHLYNPYFIINVVAMDNGYMVTHTMSFLLTDTWNSDGTCIQD